MMGLVSWCRLSWLACPVGPKRPPFAWVGHVALFCALVKFFAVLAVDSLRNGFFASRQLCLYILCCFLFCLVLVNKFEALCGMWTICCVWTQGVSSYLFRSLLLHNKLKRFFFLSELKVSLLLHWCSGFQSGHLDPLSESRLLLSLWMKDQRCHFSVPCYALLE